MPNYSNIAPAEQQRSTKPPHHPDVYRYRTNVTDKCMAEVAAAEMRSATFTPVGSHNYMIIAPVCDRSCGAKYHWCSTCFLAPRCDCMMPHFSQNRYEPDPELSWYLDQTSAAIRFAKIPCDNRYWAAVNKIRGAATGSDSGFCKQCASGLQSLAKKITHIYGRTYLEQMHHMWKIINDFICEPCVSHINKVACVHSGATCLSANLDLITDRLINYQSRKFGGEKLLPAPSFVAKSKSEIVSRNSIPEAWNASIKITKSKTSRRHQNRRRVLKPSDMAISDSDNSETSYDSFAILPGVVSSVLDEDAPMLLASQLMNLWFPESDDDMPLGKDLGSSLEPSLNLKS